MRLQSLVRQLPYLPQADPPYILDLTEFLYIPMESAFIARNSIPSVPARTPDKFHTPILIIQVPGDGVPLLLRR